MHYGSISSSVLVYDVENKKVLKEWWELPTDKRGLNAAKEYLRKKENSQQEI
jgi:hypothetical protein